MALSSSGKRRLAGRLQLVWTSLLAFAVFVAVVALGTRPAFKRLIDLTPEARFTVSAETESLLADLRAADVKLRVDTFYGRLPTPRTPAERQAVTIHGRIQQLTDDFLTRVGELGGDTVEVHRYDVMGDVAASRARIEELGGLSQDDVVVVSVGARHKELSLSLDLAEIELPAMRNSSAPGAQQALPTFKVYKGEEAVASAARTLLVEGTPRIYVLQGYREAELTSGVADSYSELMTALRAEGFEVALWNLEKEGRVPEGADILACFEPRDEIGERAAEVLFQWIQGGGRFVLDLSWSEVSGPTWNPTWDELGRRCGFRYDTRLLCHLVPDPSIPQSPGVGGIVARNLVVQGVSSQHPITRPLAQRSRFPRLKLAREIVGLGAATPDGVAYEPILRSGPWAWLAGRDALGEDADYAPPADRGAFAERDLASVVDVRGVDAERTGHVVLLSGMLFVNSLFQSNGDFALNLFNWLAQRNALVTVRGNRYRGERIELAPQQIERVQTLVRYSVPGLLLGLGLFVLWMRRRA
jgi:hypothetical protein